MNEPEIAEWRYELMIRLQPYMDVIRTWWETPEPHTYDETGVYDISTDTAPGLFVRFTRVAVRSPIKYIQAFPFINVNALQLAQVPGGVLRMVEEVCKGYSFLYDEFTVIHKYNVPAIFNKGHWLAIIPTDKLQQAIEQLGLWIYMTHEEMKYMAEMRKVPKTVLYKLLLKL